MAIPPSTLPNAASTKMETIMAMSTLRITPILPADVAGSLIHCELRQSLLQYLVRTIAPSHYYPDTCSPFAYSSRGCARLPSKVGGRYPFFITDLVNIRS